MSVAVLFARRDSVYKTLADVEVYDEDRDARSYAGPFPVVAHPPCRAWGRLAHMAKPKLHERDLARFSIEIVRQWGGVLEHPAFSKLWTDQTLPKGRQRDAFGGFTVDVDQRWWGHPATKRSWFYIVGVEPRAVEIPLDFTPATHVISTDTRNKRKRLAAGLGTPPTINHGARERTPAALAAWLVELASRCGHE